MDVFALTTESVGLLVEGATKIPRTVIGGHVQGIHDKRSQSGHGVTFSTKRPAISGEISGMLAPIILDIFLM